MLAARGVADASTQPFRRLRHSSDRPDEPVAAKPAPPKQTAPRMHTVKAGENLYQISRQYNISVEELRKLNGIGGDLIIKPGQQLKVSAP